MWYKHHSLIINFHVVEMQELKMHELVKHKTTYFR